MTTFVFRSTDADTPRWSGTAGDLTNLFDKVFVTGYNALTGVTVTRSGSTATFSKASHGFVTGQIVRHSGFTETEYNVDGKITVLSSSTWSISVAGTPTTPGATSGNAKMCPLDWTSAYTGSNKAAFRNRTASNQFYWRLDDSNAQNAQSRWYETMSDVDTGTGLAPTTGQIALGSGPYIYKSNSATTTARAWKIFSNGKFLHVFWKWDGTSWIHMMFGDYPSYVTADAFNTLQTASLTASASWAQIVYVSEYTASGQALNTYLVRGYAQTGAAVTGCFTTFGFGDSTSRPIGGLAGLVPTNPTSTFGGLVMGRIHVSARDSVGEGVRGRIPGLWCPFVNRAMSDADTLSGAAGTGISGRTFEVVNLSTTGQCLVETSDTWD
jgi:hypothetical protein